MPSGDVIMHTQPIGTSFLFQRSRRGECAIRFRSTDLKRDLRRFNNFTMFLFFYILRFGTYCRSIKSGGRLRRTSVCGGTYMGVGYPMRGASYILLRGCVYHIGNAYEVTEMKIISNCTVHLHSRRNASNVAGTLYA